MKTKEFFSKFMSGYLLGNLLAMVVVIVLLCFGVKYGLDWYTHHGQGVTVPKVEGMIFAKAHAMVLENGLNIMVSDSGYNKRLPANCILAQSPGEGTKVKEGHTIYVTVNSPSSPSFAIPDVVDNSSYREAEAKLMAIGFKLLPPKYVPGEKDWVYGIVSHGRRVSTGDMVSIDSPLTLMVGSGMYDEENDYIDYVEPGYQQFLQSGDDTGGDISVDTGGDDIDEFEEVREP